MKQREREGEREGERIRGNLFSVEKVPPDPFQKTS